MKIYPLKDENGCENGAYEIYNPDGDMVGRAAVIRQDLPKIWASRPVLVTIGVDCTEGADALLGAAYAHAWHLMSESGEHGCIRVALQSGDNALEEQLRFLGIESPSSLVRMRAHIRRSELEKEPEGMVLIKDVLADEAERRFFLERANAVFDEERDMAWLDSLRTKEGFSRLTLVDNGGTVAELVTWLEGRTAVIDRLFVVQEHRRKGYGSYLLRAAAMSWALHGIKEMRMDVWSRLIPIMRLAVQFGFEEEETLMEYPYTDYDPERNASGADEE